MKKTVLLSLCALSAATAAYSQASLRLTPASEILSAPAQKVNIKKADLPVYNMPTRGFNELITSFTATHAESWDYKDMSGIYPDNHGYYLLLSNMELVDRAPQGEGQLVQIYLVAPQSDSDLPVPGTYTFNDEYESFTFGSNIAEYYDVFLNPENPSDGLVAYKFNLTGGTVVIAEENGIYTIEVNVSGIATNNPANVENFNVSYNGEIEYFDPNAPEPYIPLGGDRTLQNLTPSGRYTEGDYNIAFYNVPLDEDGFVIGPGDLMATEIFVPSVTPMNLDDLCGTFTAVDAMTDGPAPGHYMQGVWYEFYGMWFAIGTNLIIFQEDGSQLTGLATEGTITISRDGDIFDVVFDLTTPENDHITGSWTGPLADYISDFTDSGVEGISTDRLSNIVGGNGCIVAPEGARVFTISGIETGKTSLQPGIYVVFHQGKTIKVTVH